MADLSHGKQFPTGRFAKKCCLKLFKPFTQNIVYQSNKTLTFLLPMKGFIFHSLGMRRKQNLEIKNVLLPFTFLSPSFRLLPPPPPRPQPPPPLSPSLVDCVKILQFIQSVLFHLQSSRLSPHLLLAVFVFVCLLFFYLLFS